MEPDTKCMYTFDMDTGDLEEVSQLGGTTENFKHPISPTAFLFSLLYPLEGIFGKFCEAQLQDKNLIKASRYLLTSATFSHNSWVFTHSALDAIDSSWYFDLAVLSSHVGFAQAISTQWNTIFSLLHLYSSCLSCRFWHRNHLWQVFNRVDLILFGAFTKSWATFYHSVYLITNGRCLSTYLLLLIPH